MFFVIMCDCVSIGSLPFFLELGIGFLKRSLLVKGGMVQAESKVTMLGVIIGGTFIKEKVSGSLYDGLDKGL